MLHTWERLILAATCRVCYEDPKQVRSRRVFSILTGSLDARESRSYRGGSILQFYWHQYNGSGESFFIPTKTRGCEL
jgi:hypothetical protein